MISIYALEEIITDQLASLNERPIGITRFADFNRIVETKQITVISGIRRCGKSTLLHQITNHFPDYYYVNFDDERLVTFDISDFQLLMTVFAKNKQSKNIFIDEIQNVTGWERFIRRIHDDGYKIVITGSNAKLLSAELGTHLTGRYIKIELFPFSFIEFLSYKQVNYSPLTTNKKAQLLKILDEYLQNGGFPDFVKYNDNEFLQRIYEDIIYRDLIVRFGIKNIRLFRVLAQYLFTNFTKEAGYNKLSKILEISSVNSVKEYISYLQECYLLFEVNKFDYALKRQYSTQKKIFAIDNGLRNSIAFKTGNDKGQMLENMVFIELLRRGHDVYYYKTNNNLEIDFYLKDKHECIQVCYTLTEKATFAREINAIETAKGELNQSSSYIITYNEEGLEGDTKIIPIWKWLIQME